ncbi:tryptophan 2,3-dioxygenase [Catellatospora sp. TT07R-123]|uniref:tryptophan 2,3-dioxygenase n=1 Tax=Catellatospora sp. TT07R-123 TaxID=2733863 RepID=UPI001B19ECA3|nr:tryptophan 2,3-dioxygenase family protein [Catellatospora sp. TT07R-123]GHJ45747.1 tryptophan 2,3-dioxygenase [Catellatospora sp. TT07R-123]
MTYHPSGDRAGEHAGDPRGRAGSPRTGGQEPGRDFGEQGGRLTYGRYLRIPELLAQQRPESRPPAHDELLFITIHQVYELWFKLLLHELADARDHLLAGETYLPRVRLERCQVIERLLMQQVDVIDTMTPQDFLEFRTNLAPASGFQSVQFREIEFLSGLKDPGFVERLRNLEPEQLRRLRARLAEPSLWDGFLTVLTAYGFAVDTPEHRLASLAAVAHDRERYGALWDLAEALLAHDQAWALWRARHVLMAERQIGTKPGTGGSAGAPYLRSRLDLRFYPDLWALRATL